MFLALYKGFKVTVISCPFLLINTRFAFNWQDRLLLLWKIKQNNYIQNWFRFYHYFSNHPNCEWYKFSQEICYLKRLLWSNSACRVPGVGKSAMKRVLRMPCSSWQEERCHCSGGRYLQRCKLNISLKLYIVAYKLFWRICLNILKGKNLGYLKNNEAPAVLKFICFKMKPFPRKGYLIA